MGLMAHKIVIETVDGIKFYSKVPLPPITMPQSEMVPLLKEMYEYVRDWRNTDGQLIGFDSHMDKKYDGIHRFLLNVKRMKALTPEKT
jgi:hypothetical protein